MPRAAQRIGVGRDLQQRGDLRGAGQLGVGNLVLPVLAHQEVGEPDKAAVEHRGLVDHRRAVGDGPLGGLRGRGQTGDGECGTADRDNPVAVFLAQRREPAALVVVTQSGGAGQQFVLDGDALTPAELRIELPQQGVFTASGGCEIRRAVDDAVACGEHSRHCMPGHRRDRPAGSGSGVGDQLHPVAVPAELHHAW